MFNDTNMKKQGREAVSKIDVLEIISDKISLDIFNEIANNSHNSNSLIRTIGVTNKQYYSRYSRLIKAGLIKKKTGTHILTSFGKVIYRAQLKIARAAQRNYTLNYVCSSSKYFDTYQRTPEGY